MHTCSVNVKNLSHTTDIPSLAKKVVDTCELINPARLPEVEQLLLYLQARKEGDAGQLSMIDLEPLYNSKYIVPVPFFMGIHHSSIEKDMLEASTRKLQKQMEHLEVSLIIYMYMYTYAHKMLCSYYCVVF